MRNTGLVLLLVAMVLGAPSFAWAEGEATGDLAERGYEAMKAERWADASAAFGEAVKHQSTPPLNLHLGRALEAQGRLVEARAAYRRAIDHPMAANAPPAFEKARQEAIEAVTDLETRLPVISIELDGELRQQAEIFVDGQATPLTRLTVDPGPHVVVAKAGGRAVERRVLAEEGQTHRVVLDESGQPRRVIYGGRLFWGAALGATSLGLTATFIYATVRLDDIEGDPGYEAFSESVRTPGNDPCVVARLGTPGVDYLAQPGAFSRGEMVKACDDADTLQALQIVSVPTAIVSGTLAAYLLANVVGTEPARVGFVPHVGPSEAGATIHLAF